MGKSIKYECLHCGGSLKLTVESNPVKVLIKHQDLQDADKWLKYPCVGNPDHWWLSYPLKTELEALYPNISVDLEARKALAWCIANPRARKTAKGMPRFINAWFSRAQDSSRVKPLTKQDMLEALGD